LAYIFVADSVGLSLFKCVHWAPKYASFLQQSAFWPFRVIEGRCFSYQSKAHIRVPISPSFWLWSYLSPFLRYGDLLAKTCLFFLRLSHSASSRPMFALEFRTDVNRQETIEPWAILQWWPHDRSLSHIDTVPGCDRRADGQTDGFTIASTALCIANYADSL